MGGALEPWWWASAVGALTALAGAAGKVWSDQRREIRELRGELATANARVLELQREAELRGDEHQREHLRDLRRLAGLSTSSPPVADTWPPAVIRPPRK